MRVLMVIPAGKGGLWAYTDALCYGLYENSIDVTALSDSAWPNAPRPFSIERRFVRIMPKKEGWTKLHWAFDRFWRSLHNSLVRNRFAIRTRPDVVHIQLATPIIDQILFKPLVKRLPVVFTAHDIQPHMDCFTSSISFIKRHFQIPHRLIVHYEGGKRELVENWGICADRIDVIPHGIMPPLHITTTPQGARKELNLPLDRRIILFFGGIRDNKGLDVLLKALEIVRLHEPRVLLVIAGSIPLRANFERYSNMIKSSGLSRYVRTFIRFIDDSEVDYFFTASDLVVLPYVKFGSQSGVLLRACAHRKPVVVTNVGALGELVRSNKIGLVVEAGASESLAEAIINVLGNLNKFRSRYSGEIEDKYSWKNIAKLTIRSYQTAIDNKNIR